MRSPPRLLVTAAVVLSGSAALVYEVVWTRQLSVFLGITLRAEAIVLAAFMLGLALGHRVLGRRADSIGRPLLLFAGLEAAIGVYGLVSTELLPSLGPWYASFASPHHLTTPSGDLTRFLVAAVALLIPTFLMGGTIPALVRSGLTGPADGPRSIASEIGTVYALNTLGAAIGAFAAGFVLLPGLGTTGTLVAAAGANLAIALALWSRERPQQRAAEPAVLEAASSADAARCAGNSSTGHLAIGPALAAFALFGASALALQLGWIQALTQVLGSSVYAFSLTLSAYLAGLAAGGLAFAVLSRKARGPRGGWASWLAFTSAIAVVLGLLAFDRLPELFLQAFRWNLESRFGWLVLFSFLVAWSLVLVPTALFGFLSPLVVSSCAPRRRTAGEDVGIALAANTGGTTLGALAAGFWLLPEVGLQNTLLLGAVGLVASAGLLFIARRPRPSWARTKAAAALLIFAPAAALTPRWDPVLVTSGPFINASRILDLPRTMSWRSALRERNRVLFYRESAIGSVSVRDVAGDRLLVINGKADGSRIGDRRTQLALGHLPALLHSDPKKILVIGFGTGMTPAALAAHPEVERLDVVEISPEVVEASRFFATENRGVLFDPRLRLVFGDARNYLLTSRSQWDLIISEPSNPWISGVANLFTREYFELVRRHLAPHGLMGQWFQSYGMSSDDLRSIVGTFSSVFESVTIWSPQPGDLILVGSGQPHGLDGRRAERLLQMPGAGDDMAATGWREGDDFARMLLLDAGAAAVFGAGAPANTDRHPRVEFNAPRNMYRETTLANLLELARQGVDVGGSESSSRVVPMRDTRTNKQQAFGLAAVGAELVPELRISRLALRTEPTGMPTLAVSLRRIVVSKPPGGAPSGAEIEVFGEAQPPARARLRERIVNLSESRVAAWRGGTLADGTPTLLGVAAGRAGPVTVAWTCPAPEPPFRTYLATVPDPDLDAFERRLRCAP